MDWKKYFDRHGEKFIRVGYCGEKYSLEVECFYQAIKARLKDELVARKYPKPNEIYSELKDKS